VPDQILFAKDGAVASIRINRPEKKNAITLAMYRAMIDALDDAGHDDDVRAVGLFGEEVFTAGNDIADFLTATEQNWDDAAIRFLQTLVVFPKPLIAGVKGVAIGIGTTMLLHCDAIVAGTSARFAMPFVKIGLVPEAGSSLLFPLIAGRMRASWLMLSGQQFDAREARELGLVTRVTEDRDVDGAVAMMCGELAELPPNAVMTTKRLLRARFAEALASAMREENAAFGAALRSDEARAAFKKFLSLS
jgi:enoyl-CoA hydratase/carnithine racemase